MEIFLDDEAGYEQWVGAHHDGYVINAPRGPASTVALVLHRAACGHIAPPGLRFTSGPYYKVCAADRDRLAAWARTQAHALKTCSTCKP